MDHLTAEDMRNRKEQYTVKRLQYYENVINHMLQRARIDDKFVQIYDFDEELVPELKSIFESRGFDVFYGYKPDLKPVKKRFIVSW